MLKYICLIGALVCLIPALVIALIQGQQSTLTAILNSIGWGFNIIAFINIFL